MKHLTPQQVSEKLQADPNALLIDCRTEKLTPRVNQRSDVIGVRAAALC